MATTLHTPTRAPSLSAAQMCQQLAAVREHSTSIKGTDHRTNNSCSDKENNDKPIHQEILDKLKHDSGMPTPLQAEQWLNYQKLRAAALGDSPYASQHAADLLRREALLSLQSSRSKFDYFNHLAALQEQHLMSTNSQGMHSPTRGSQSPDGSEDADVKLEMLSPNPGPNGGGQWTYEEQFKQLYELGDEPDRKAFLDELFAFMQKRGTPVNRIPIMAKQTLDMFKLFKLVVSKGGLVEVINKKLWREITKGLNLPSSITSAAFTLRTQYMKYIYPYECEKYAFSTPSELQAAIDGNRREGRRPGYAYEMSSPASLTPFYGQQNFPTANPFFNPLMNNPMASLLSSQLSGAYMNPNSINGGPINHPRLSAPLPSAGSSTDDRSQSPINVSSPLTKLSRPAFRRSHSPDNCNERSPKKLRSSSPERHSIGSKSPSIEVSETDRMNTEDRLSALTPFSSENISESQKSNDMKNTNTTPVISLSSSHLKLATNNSSIDRSGKDNSESVAVSMEVNGVIYQGVLFAKKKEIKNS